MTHKLETEYGLTAKELLDAIDRRFRAKVTLEGAVAEVQLGKLVKQLHDLGAIAKFENHDTDGYPDYTVWPQIRPDEPLLLECKNVRDSDEAYRDGGQIVAFKVETQKTRTSQGDKSSRFYGTNQFDILAVCLGKKTHDWKQFLFIATKDLKRHATYPSKLAVMHQVPLPSSPVAPPWYTSLAELLKAMKRL